MHTNLRQAARAQAAVSLSVSRRCVDVGISDAECHARDAGDDASRWVTGPSCHDARRPARPGA